MKKATYIEMDYGELEQLIKQTYSHEFEFVADVLICRFGYYGLLW